MDVDEKASDDSETSMQVESEANASIDMDINHNKSLGMDGSDKEIFQSMENLIITEPFKRKPVIIIVVGMPGSGKTTFMHQLVRHSMASNIRGYAVNLDPTVMTLPYGANIDIRDTVRYKEVMNEFNVGPNGGILTSLNLFSTKFDEVVSVIENRADQLDYCFVDTPGQIEIFTGSASGAIITEAFASTFPTVIAYVVDTPLSTNPGSFRSNMLSACSILCKTRLPLILAFNKTDVAQHQFALEWMADFEALQAALDSYTSTLFQSVSLELEELNKNLRSVGVSAVSGAGMDYFFTAVEASAEEYMEKYRTELNKGRAAKIQCLYESMDRLRKDMEKSRRETMVLNTGLKDSYEESMSFMVDEEFEEDVEDVTFEGFSGGEEDSIDEDEDENEEVSSFSF